MKWLSGFIIVVCLAGAAAADELNEQPRRRTVDVSLGGLVYFCTWNPVWKKQVTANIAFTQFEEYRLTSWRFIGGPLFSVRHKNGWSVSANGTYGTFKADYSGYIAAINRLIPIPSVANLYLTAEKIDADCIISKNFNQYVKIFFGPKYQGYVFKSKKIEEWATLSGATIFKNEKSQLYSGGFGVGMGGTIPLGFSFYVLPSASLVAMSGVSVSGKTKTVPLSFGGNGQILITYQIDAANLSISLGGKANYLYYYLLPDKSYQNRHDYFYGGVLMLAYTF